jgi:hypothetical protein
MLQAHARRVTRIFTAVALGVLAGCSEPVTAPTDTDFRRPSLLLLDDDGNPLPGQTVWLDEAAQGYTQAWDESQPGYAEVIAPPGGFGSPTMVSGSPEPVPCDITVPGAMNTCPPQIIHGDGGGVGPPGGGNWWPPQFPPPPPPTCCVPGGGVGGDPGVAPEPQPPPPTQPQPPRVTASGYPGAPNSRGYRAPQKVTVSTPIVIDVFDTETGTRAYFTVINSTWERISGSRTKDNGEYGVQARYALRNGDFQQVGSTLPGAQLAYVINVVMISKLVLSPDGSWGGGFRQDHVPAASDWTR